ncbi:hypothetical protein AHiyo1_40220 [Arthrobacter sp. Hiyo1]|nr:hypothetical protein AHiyo1_40220 [Arthrobacter sp. Hiyo1]
MAEHGEDRLTLGVGEDKRLHGGVRLIQGVGAQDVDLVVQEGQDDVHRVRVGLPGLCELGLKVVQGQGIRGCRLICHGSTRSRFPRRKQFPAARRRDRGWGPGAVFRNVVLGPNPRSHPRRSLSRRTFRPCSSKRPFQSIRRIRQPCSASSFSLCRSSKITSAVGL